MHAAPHGFTLVPGAASGDVFVVERSGVTFVCKRLPRRALGEAWARDRLAGEAQLLRALGGRCAPRLEAAGEDDRGPWLVMDRVAWPPLGARTAVVDAAWVARAARAVLEALAQVHAADVVHADLSPENVLVADDAARAIILDFGLAHGPGMPALPPGPFRGTLLYAAPEVARGEPFDARADLFAAAASLLQVASGDPPRAHPSQAAMLLAAGEEPISPWALRAAAGLASTAAEALVACCEHDPARRPASAAQVLAALR